MSFEKIRKVNSKKRGCFLMKNFSRSENYSKKLDERVIRQQPLPPTSRTSKKGLQHSDFSDDFCGTGRGKQRSQNLFSLRTIISHKKQLILIKWQSPWNGGCSGVGWSKEIAGIKGLERKFLVRFINWCRNSLTVAVWGTVWRFFLRVMPAIRLFFSRSMNRRLGVRRNFPPGKLIPKEYL